ncbi:galactofuranosylgalactofuranosylrhamnosyl-N-acetylglucosaminyl-diphospho-decaprenol beta-1,5/1,6-galactofuranosyltransferase [Microbacterium sp. SORGH_AS 505]|uniref:glycosyltransferase n=1 Tax=Microbacterium sp. SORGH_AS_0505 TaxID=3041770 RepID=UPI0027897BAB|nr:glycosyltransferase [Microbacterium sp. SORGH_AS_0505]MDQ1125242.1 galactofuranosylgalactofuranosylrhamnosyl-N-acetylglucosaminyl-diphospho-decaprenol beta-1,5/1,6-galactofuranosyltransferase [Microbacterium sp. SORGH_AS_0505]
MTHVLANVVFPVDRDPDILPLYLDPETWSTIEGEGVRVSANAQLGDVLDRRRARIAAGRRMSFATYFNAFPASYWQHWTSVRRIRLTVELSGEATLLVYRSNGGGIRQRIVTHEVSGESTTEVDLDLTQYTDGGWIWFDVVADTQDVTFRSGIWSTDQEPARGGKASIGITTYNKPEYCVETLQSLIDAPDVLENIDRIFVIDQGDKRVDAREEYPAIAEGLGETLQVITQPNLGGSGGFARAMLETLDRPDSDFVQLLDDDVRIEPEALRRSIVFGRFTTTPTIVGGHMFDLLDRPKLHAWAEVVDDKPFMWRNLFQERMPHDFGAQNLRQTPTLHMRMDAHYNGWWMCLIPMETVREIGLSLPAFIKWDDAEYCLRAGEAGYATVSLPGVALWHVSWLGKDDAIDWQAYFHVRNRVVAGLLHSQTPRGGTLIRHSRRVDIKHLMMMQYYPTHLRAAALRDVLSGPAHMFRSLDTAMPAARTAASRFPETTVHKDVDAILRSRKGRQVFSVPRRAERDRVKDTSSSPTGILLRAFTGVSLASHWFHTPKRVNLRTPEVEFGKGDANWWRIPRYDSVLVSAADGSGKQIYTRNRALFRKQLVESVILHRRLQRRWAKLAAQYRKALPGLVSPEAWRRVFEENK